MAKIEVGLSALIGENMPDEKKERYYILESAKNPPPRYSDPQIFIGLVIMVFAVFFKAAKMVYEELILNKYQVSPYRVIGLEGLYGMIFVVNWMYLLSFIRCPSSKICNVSSINNGKINKKSEWDH